jgi:hypothetical protein
MDYFLSPIFKNKKLYQHLYKEVVKYRMQLCTSGSVILATQEAEIRRIGSKPALGK